MSRSCPSIPRIKPSDISTAHTKKQPPTTTDQKKQCGAYYKQSPRNRQPAGIYAAESLPQRPWDDCCQRRGLSSFEELRMRPSQICIHVSHCTLCQLINTSRQLSP